MRLDLAVTGVGLLTPTGLSAPVAFHSIRSGVTRLREQRTPERTGQPTQGGEVLSWTMGVGARRLQEYAERAIEEASAGSVGGTLQPRRVPAALLLGSPEELRPGHAFPPKALDLRQWFGSLGFEPVGPIEIIPAGACSTQTALERADSILRAGEVRACVVGAVDSQLPLKVVRWHESKWRLKRTSMADGLIPGEASAFLVVEREEDARRRGACVFARIVSTASAREDANVLGDQPNTARGLTTAVRTALADAGVEVGQVDAIWCDLNGESYRAREWAFAEIRLRFTTATELYHPADANGDVGVATDATLLGLAACAQATGWAHGKPILVFAGSEGGLRAATVLVPPGQADGPRAARPVTEGEPRTIEAEIAVPPLGPDEELWEESDDPPRAFFEWELRQEHREEMASLYDQRKALLHDSEIPWRRVREPEQRLLSRLDAVVAGGSPSVWAVASGLMGDDEGSCFAGTLLLGSLSGARSLEPIEKVLETPEATSLAGIEEGVKHAPHPGVEARIASWLGHPSREVRAMAIRLAGWRREGDPARLVPFVEGGDPGLSCAAAEALGRLRFLAAIPLLDRLLAKTPLADPETVFLAALRLGSRSAMERLRQFARDGWTAFPAGPVLLALGGDASDLPTILGPGGVVRRAPVATALGVLGLPEGVPALIAALRSEEEPLRVAAGEALERLTAAGLRETATVVEEVPGFEEGTVEKQERKVERVSTSSDQWAEWWTRNGRRFSPGSRFRLGRRFELAVVRDELAGERSDYDTRRRAALELEIRAQRGVPFEPDAFVPRQERAIQWWRDEGARGDWR